MAELEAKLKAIQRRLFVFRFIEWLARAGLIAAVLAVVHLLAVRVFGAPGEPLLVTAGLLGGAVLVALGITLFRRVTLREAAIAADESLGLRERLSSALLLKGFRDPNGVVEALERDAAAHARAIQVSKDFRFRAPRLARHLVWPVAIFVGAYVFLPQFDLFAKTQSEVPEVAEEDSRVTERMRREDAQRVRELARETRSQLEDAPELESDARMADRLERLSDDLALGRRERRAAIAELSRMEDEVNMRREEIERSVQPFRQIQGLQRSQQTREIQNDLKNNDFSSAAQRMQTMATQQLQTMDSQQTRDMAEEMRRLADELRDNRDMADALRSAADALEQLSEAKSQQEQQQQQQDQQAGADQQQGQQAGQQDQQASADGQDQQSGQQDQAAGQQQQDGSAGQEQAAAGQQQQQPGSDSAQGQQQQQQAGAQNQQQQGSQPDGQQGEGQSQSQNDAMAQANEAMQRAAQAMQDQNEMMQQMQKLNQLSQSMSDTRSQMLSSNQQQQQQDGQQSMGGNQRQENTPGGRDDRQFPNAQAGGDCPGGDCPPGAGNMMADDGSGRWQEGDSTAMSMGDDGGGPGRGVGYRPDAGLVDVDFEDELVIGQRNEGEIIAVMEIDAPALAGESTVNFTEILSTRQQVGADTVRQNEIPQGYQGAVRDYFESIRGSSQE